MRKVPIQLDHETQMILDKLHKYPFLTIDSEIQKLTIASIMFRENSPTVELDKIFDSKINGLLILNEKWGTSRYEIYSSVLDYIISEKNTTEGDEALDEVFKEFYLKLKEGPKELLTQFQVNILSLENRSKRVYEIEFGHQNIPPNLGIGEKNRLKRRLIGRWPSVLMGIDSKWRINATNATSPWYDVVDNLFAHIEYCSHSNSESDSYGMEFCPNCSAYFPSNGVDQDSQEEGYFYRRLTKE